MQYREPFFSVIDKMKSAQQVSMFQIQSSSSSARLPDEKGNAFLGQFLLPDVKMHLWDFFSKILPDLNCKKKQLTELIIYLSLIN